MCIYIYVDTGSISGLLGLCRVHKVLKLQVSVACPGNEDVRGM